MGNGEGKNRWREVLSHHHLAMQGPPSWNLPFCCLKLMLWSCGHDMSRCHRRDHCLTKEAPPPQKKWNYLLEGGPLEVQASPVGEYSRSPSVSVFQLAVVRNCIWFQWIFFWRLSMHLPILMDNLPKQHSAVKVCFLLGKNEAEMVTKKLL